jgi:hypothetical protein
MLAWQLVDCEKCQSPKGSRCRTLTSGKITDTHSARMDAAWVVRREQIRRSR